MFFLYINFRFNHKINFTHYNLFVLIALSRARENRGAALTHNKHSYKQYTERAFYGKKLNISTAEQ